jgi:hypothetical protein
MGLIKITFDSASVTSKQDADLNHFLANRQNGRVSGILNAVTPSTSNNYISFTSGYVQVYGRRVFVEAGTKIAVSLDGTAYGYIYIAFDLANNSVSLSKREGSSGYPALTQEDLMNGGYLYELPIARYTKTSSSLTLDTGYTVPYIKSAETIAGDKAGTALTTCASRYGSVYQETGTIAYGTTYKFTGINSINASNGIASVYVGGCHVLFSTDAAKGSGGVVNYYFNEQHRQLTVQLTDSCLYIQASDGSVPKYVRVVR